MNFTKMHGTGNDFIIIEDLEHQCKDESTLARDLCSRHFGIGGDGILIVRRSKIADIQMVIINSDGSYASMCGNGIRCFARYVYDHQLVDRENIKIETGDGIKEACLHVENGIVKSITINMGDPNFDPASIPSTFKEEIFNKEIHVGRKEYVIHSMLMGVPHTVIIGDIEKFDVTEGKRIERYTAFPMGTNVNFCQVINSKVIQVKTWERGAGPTLACGTGSCASVVACNRMGLIDKKVMVKVPGGELVIEITDQGVYMSGPAEVIFQGQYLL
jgi:diaminopimelate epimerase